jgi:hypothetical protein
VLPTPKENLQKLSLQSIEWRERCEWERWGSLWQTYVISGRDAYACWAPANGGETACTSKGGVNAALPDLGEGPGVG